MTENEIGKVFVSATRRLNPLTWTFKTQEEADRLESMIQDFVASKVYVIDGHMVGLKENGRE